MSAPKSLSRRRFLLFAALMGSVKAFAGDDSKKGGDNGIGGTGFRPGDNGLGGTGFIGSIRKFGSVYVNGERIAYPADAIIEIDGSRATPADMRLGQVARLVAERADNVWTTHRIVIVSEAIGSVERIRGKKLDILGQRILLPSARIARALKVGDRIAVGGLRRPDQTIVASSVERVPGGLDQIAGLVQRHASGGLRIGGQKIAGVSDALAGSRIVARGALDNGVFVVREAQNEAEIGIGGARNVSVETWVSRRAGGLETAGGVRVEDRGGGAPAGARLVVINGAFGADGSLVARQIERVDPRRGFDAPGGGPNGGPGGGQGGRGSGGRGPGGMGDPGGSGGAPGGRPGGFLQHGPERGGLDQRRFGAPGGGAFPDAPGTGTPGIGLPSGGTPGGGNPSGGLPPTGGSPFGGPGAFPGGPGAFPGGPGAFPSGPGAFPGGSGPFPGGPGGFTGPPGGRFR